MKSTILISLIFFNDLLFSVNWKWTVISLLVFILVSFILISTAVMLFQRPEVRTVTPIFLPYNVLDSS